MSRTVLDFILDEARRAMTDVREKLVEEPWFGRRLSPPHRSEPHNDLAALWGGQEKSHGAAQLSFEELWGPSEHTQPPNAPGGHDIDR